MAVQLGLSFFVDPFFLVRHCFLNMQCIEMFDWPKYDPWNFRLNQI